MNRFQKFQQQQIQGLDKIKGGATLVISKDLISQDLQDWWRANGGGRAKSRELILQDLQDWWKINRRGQFTREGVSIILDDNASNEIILRG